MALFQPVLDEIGTWAEEANPVVALRLGLTCAGHGGSRRFAPASRYGWVQDSSFVQDSDSYGGCRRRRTALKTKACIRSMSVSSPGQGIDLSLVHMPWHAMMHPVRYNLELYVFLQIWHLSRHTIPTVLIALVLALVPETGDVILHSILRLPYIFTISRFHIPDIP